MNEKYVKLSDVKKKLNYIYRTYGVSPQMKRTISDALARIPCAVKGELETTLEAEPVKHGEWVLGEFDIPHCSECGEKMLELAVSKYCPFCGAKMDLEEDE